MVDERVEAAGGADVSLSAMSFLTASMGSSSGVPVMRKSNTPLSGISHVSTDAKNAS